MRIALFARPEIIHKVSGMKNEYPDLEISYFPYTEAKETATLLSQAFMCDIYIFGETLAYLYVKHVVEKKKLPKIIIAFDEYKIMTALYQLSYVKKQPLRRLSIDVYQEAALEEVCTELHMDQDTIYPYAYGEDGEPDLDEVVHHHQFLWKTGKTDHALTSIKEVEEKLMALQIPTTCMLIPSRNIKLALEEARELSKLDQHKSVQIVAGYVRIKNWENKKKSLGEAFAMENLLRLYQRMLTFGRETGSSVTINQNNQIVLYGTKRLLTYITGNYREFPLLTELENVLNTPLDIGFGLGLTAIQAENNAKTALAAGVSREGSHCYIVNERQEKIGPIGIKKEFDTSKLYHALIHKARLNNELSYNFIDFISMRNNEPFSSQDVAVHYRVTKRSAERTINKLLHGEVIKIVGEEKPYVRGRPRKLFAVKQ
jgi:hypothetical protein